MDVKTVELSDNILELGDLRKMIEGNDEGNEETWLYCPDPTQKHIFLGIRQKLLNGEFIFGSKISKPILSGDRTITKSKVQQPQPSKIFFKRSDIKRDSERIINTISMNGNRPASASAGNSYRSFSYKMPSINVTKHEGNVCNNGIATESNNNLHKIFNSNIEDELNSTFVIDEPGDFCSSVNNSVVKSTGDIPTTTDQDKHRELKRTETKVIKEKLLKPSNLGTLTRHKSTSCIPGSTINLAPNTGGGLSGIRPPSRIPSRIPGPSSFEKKKKGKNEKENKPNTRK